MGVWPVVKRWLLIVRVWRNIFLGGRGSLHLYLFWPRNFSSKKKSKLSIRPEPPATVLALAPAANPNSWAQKKPDRGQALRLLFVTCGMASRDDQFQDCVA